MRNFVIIAIFLQATIAFGQQDEQSSLYMYNALYYNPAYAGSRNTINVNSVGRYQWVGFKGAPQTAWFSASAPLKNRSMGIGTHIIGDKIGARKRTSAYIDLSGSVQVNKKGDRFAAGLSLGVDNVNLNYQDIYVVDANDPYSGIAYSKTTLNAGVGAYYYGERFYAGFSVPRIIKRKDRIGDQEFGVMQQHYYLTGGYVFKLNSVLDLKPSTMVKFTSGSPIACDLNVSLLAYKKYWIGGMYRLNEGAGVNASIQLNEMFTVGYAYDFPLNRLMGNQSGTHEIVLQLDLTRYKGNNRQYSPRYF